MLSVIEKIAILRDRFGVRFCPRTRKWRQEGSNREVTRERIVMHLFDAFPDELPAVIMQDVIDHVDAAHREKTEERLAEIPDRMDEFKLVDQWMAEFNVVVHENGTYENGDPATLPLAVHRYNRAVSSIPADVRKEKGISRLSVTTAKEVLDGVVADLHYQALEGMREKIRFNPRRRRAALEAYDQLVDILAAPNDPHRKLHRAILIHMIWQIKRKLFGLLAKDHILLFLFGLQGGGKTTLIRKIGAVLGSLYVEPSVDELYAKFGSSFTADHYMANLEEFTWAAGQETQAMKKFVTQDVRSERRMHSMGTQRRPQNLTLFASSNRKLRRVFSDYSGMRRFWEIDCDWARPHLDHAAVNALDYEALFQGVDENNEISPIRRDPEIFAQINQVQDKWRKQSVVEIWLRANDMYPVLAGDATVEMEIEGLFRQFNDWSEEHDRKSMGSLERFRGMLEDLRDIEGTFDRPNATVTIKKAGRAPTRSHDDSGLGAKPATASTGWEDFE